MQHRIESNVTKPAVPVRIEHGIPAYLSSDEALVHAISRYPDELVDIGRYDFTESGRVILTPGRRGAAAAETVLDAIKNGQLCVTLNSIERAHPGLWAEVLSACASFGPQLEGVKAEEMTARLVISSATARFPCRFDTRNVVLFHLRGFQRVWVYPTDEAHLPQIEVEKTISGQAGGDIAHNRIEDNAAWRFGVVPGEALAWPLHAPHYSENEEGLCVSVVLSYETAESRLTNGVHLANGVLRSWRRDLLRLEETPLLQRRLLWLSSVVLSAIGLVQRNTAPVRPVVVETARIAIEQDWRIDRRSLAA